MNEKPTYDQLARALGELLETASLYAPHLTPEPAIIRAAETARAALPAVEHGSTAAYLEAGIEQHQHARDYYDQACQYAPPVDLQSDDPLSSVADHYAALHSLAEPPAPEPTQAEKDQAHFDEFFPGRKVGMWGIEEVTPARTDLEGRVHTNVAVRLYQHGTDHPGYVFQSGSWETATRYAAKHGLELCPRSRRFAEMMIELGVKHRKFLAELEAERAAPATGVFNTAAPPPKTPGGPS